MAGHSRIARLMRLHCLRGVSRRRGCCVTTRRDPEHRAARDLVGRHRHYTIALPVSARAAVGTGKMQSQSQSGAWRLEGAQSPLVTTATSALGRERQHGPGDRRRTTKVRSLLVRPPRRMTAMEISSLWTVRQLCRLYFETGHRPGDFLDAR